MPKSQSPLLQRPACGPRPHGIREITTEILNQREPPYVAHLFLDSGDITQSNLVVVFACLIVVKSQFCFQLRFETPATRQLQQHAAKYAHTFTSLELSSRRPTTFATSPPAR